MKERNADVRSLSLSDIPLLLYQLVCIPDFLGLWHVERATPGSVYKGPSRTFLCRIKQKLCIHILLVLNQQFCILVCVFLIVFYVWAGFICVAFMPLLLPDTSRETVLVSVAQYLVLCGRWSPSLTNGLLPLGYFCSLHPCSTLFQEELSLQTHSTTPAPL